jgi:hypothetical protein
MNGGHVFFRLARRQAPNRKRKRRGQSAQLVLRTAVFLKRKYGERAGEVDCTLKFSG